MLDGWRRLDVPALSTPARVALIYAAMFYVTGITTPYIAVWQGDIGFSIAEIGMMSVIPQVLRSFCAPAIGFQADRRQAHRTMVIWLAVLGVLAWLLLLRTPGFALALMAFVLLAFSHTMSPLVESIAMAGVRTQGHDYGRMRLWGSAAFIAANLMGGWIIGWFGIGSFIWLVLAGALFTVLAAMLLQQPDMSGGGGGVRKPLTLADAGALLKLPQMLWLLLAACAVQGAHGMFYMYGTLHWQKLGIGAQWFGALWAVGLVTEIALFWWSKEAVRWIGAAGLLAGACALSVFRWLMMSFDPPLSLLVPLQVLHGLTFGASHLGAIHLLAKIAPLDRSATAQSLYSLVTNLGVQSAVLVSAMAYPSAGGGTYWIMAAMAAVGVVAAEVVRKRV